MSLVVISDSLIVPPKGQHSTDDVYSMIQQLNTTVIQQNAVLMYKNAELNTTLTQMKIKLTQQDATIAKMNSLLSQQNVTLLKQADVSKQQNAAIQSLLQKDSMYFFLINILLHVLCLVVIFLKGRSTVLGQIAIMQVYNGSWVFAFLYELYLANKLHLFGCPFPDFPWTTSVCINTGGKCVNNMYKRGIDCVEKTSLQRIFSINIRCNLYFN